ncbi:MAG: nucleotide exchange factor GrpE [Kiritimatiellae bacterium]|nr:nucleotide exchange factor GrpE [Kiritimatiellia bacterium]
MEEKKETETPVTPQSENEEQGTETNGEQGTGNEATAEDGETAVNDVPPPEPDWKDLYARLLADFDNYKKRAARDREDTYRYAEADILGDILAVVDNLSLALSKAEDKENPFVKGVSLVYDSMLSVLKTHGAEPFDSVGRELDTEKMEAIATLPSEEIEEGKVTNEVKRGWMLKGKVLRAAQVVVSSGKTNG